MDVLAGSALSASAYCAIASSNCPSRTYAAPRFDSASARSGAMREHGLVGVDGAEDVAGLVQLDRAREELLGVGGACAPVPPPARRGQERELRSRTAKREASHVRAIGNAARIPCKYTA